MVSIFESLTFYLISLITAIFIGLYFYFIRNFKFWQKLGVPYVKPVPFFGNLKDCVFLKTTTGEQLQRIYAENSDNTYVGIFSFDKPSLVIRDLELVKDVLMKDFKTFIDRALSVDEKTDPLFSKVLAIIRGQLWRHLRTNLSPVFTSGKIKKMFYLVDTCGKELAECLHKDTADGSPVEVKETMGRFTTDVIASCAFGINSNSLNDPDAEFGLYLRKEFHFTVNKGLAWMTAFCAPNLKSLFRMKMMDDKTNNIIRQTVWSTVGYSDYKLPAPTENGTITIPAGISVYIPVLAIHHDPTYFPKPETFDPDRFTEENKRSRPNYAYIPFGEGPRMCIGMRFALMQVKTGLCYILSRFEVAPFQTHACAYWF